MYCNNSFSTPLIANHTSHGAYSSLFEGSLACISNAAVVGCCVQVEYEGSEPKLTFAWQKIAACLWNACLNHDFFLACLKWSCSPGSAIFVSLYAYHELSTRLIWVTTSLALFCNRSRCSIKPPYLRASRKSPGYGCARRSFLQLKSSRDLSFPKLRAGSLNR